MSLLRFLQNFNNDLELIYAKYSNSPDDGPELLLSACDEPENRKLLNNYSFSSCVDWRVSPDSEDSSLTDSSLPINSSCSSSDENSGLLSYHKDEVSGDVYTTPVHSSGEESGFSNSDGWESDSSGPIRSYKTDKNKPRSCDKYDNDDNLYSHTRKYSRKNKKFSKTSSDNRIDLFNAKCPPKKHPNIVGHSDLLTAVHKFHNLFTNHFARSETRCNHLPELSMIPKALDNCYDEKNLGSLEVNRQEFCKESGKKRRFLKAKKSTAVQPSYVVEKLFVRPKGSPMNSFVEIASCQSFNTKTKVDHHQLQSSPFKCFETLSTSNMQRSLDAISGWTKPLPRSPVSDTKCWALDPKISLTPVSNDRVRSLVVKAPSATQSCPPRRCFQVSSADGNQHGSFSAVASLTHDLDEILSADTLTSQSSSVNKSEYSRKLRPWAKYSGVKSPGVKSPDVKSSGVKSPGVKVSLGVKSPGVKSPGVKSPGVKISLGVKSSVVKSSGVESSGLKSPIVKSPGVKSSGLKSPSVKSPGVKSLNVLRSDADGAQIKPTTPSEVNKCGPRQSKPETPQEKVKGNHFDRFTSPVSSNDDSPRIKNSLKMKNTRRRNSLGFHPYGYSNRKQSPSSSSPLQALAIVSPSLACDETLRRSSPGHRPKPRRSIESEIKSKKSSESQKKLAFDAFEKHAASDNSDVMQDCCPGNCTKKFCFNCAMDCS